MLVYLTFLANNISGCYDFGYEGYDCDDYECNYSLGYDWYDKWRAHCRKKCGTCIGEKSILSDTMFFIVFRKLIFKGKIKTYLNTIYNCFN